MCLQCDIIAPCFPSADHALQVDPRIDLHRAVVFLLETEFGIHYDEDEMKMRGRDRAAVKSSTRKPGGNGTKKRRSKTPPRLSTTNGDRGHKQIKRTMDKDAGNKMEKNGNWNWTRRSWNRWIDSTLKHSVSFGNIDHANTKNLG